MMTEGNVGIKGGIEFECWIDDGNFDSRIQLIPFTCMDKKSIEYRVDVNVYNVR